MSSTIEQIKDRIDIIDLISTYIPLQRAGANSKAPCPFHSERTPSFVVSPVRQTYHCFGCGEHGDIFTFVEKMEGVDFKGALKILADKAGVEIKYDKSKKSKEETDKLDQMFECMFRASEYFYQRLLENKDALDYLINRGFTKETITRFQIGFALNNWHALEKTLVAAGFKQEIIEETGLIIKGDKGYYDRFRSRIMFPIRDSAGRVVAFSGRIFGQLEKDIKNAKYINSPETQLYNKSKILFGFDMAKQSIRKNDFVILVEGQMDLVACHQAGYTNTVAISGTALTPEHCKILGRMSKNIILALDADEAGLKAAGRSAIIALADGFDTKVAHLPDGQDPADVLQQNDIEIWKNIIKNSKHIIEFLLDIYESKYSDNKRKFKKKVEEVILPFLIRIKSKIDQDHFIKLVSGRIGVTESTLLITLENIKLQPEPKQTIQPAKAQIMDYRKHFSPISILASIIAWQDSLDNSYIDIEAIKDRVILLIGQEKFNEAINSVNDADIIYVEDMYTTPESVQAVVAERLEYLRQGTLRAKRLELTQSLIKAESIKDKQQIKELQQKINQVNKELENY